MPFSSKAQRRKCFALKARNKNSGWNCEEWDAATTNPKSLPEHVKKATYTMADAFAKIAKELFDPKKNPPLPSHEIQKQNINAVKDDKTKGLTAVEYRNKQSKKSK